MKLPAYPVYIPSKGRIKHPYTADQLVEYEVPFHIVVEPQEEAEYRAKFGDHVLVLPFSNLGLGSIPARNWIWDHAKESGAERHWIIDDNVRRFMRLYKGERIPCEAGLALYTCEQFTDRYTNIALSGLAYKMFVGKFTAHPYYHNVHVYSCTLIKTDIPNRWRGRYNEDVDLCLQVLADGWCTVLINVYSADKLKTMIVKGGNTAELYAGDGRLTMARSLERMWPGTVRVDRRFGRPQHVVNWKKFDTPLIRRDDFNWEELPDIDEFGADLVAQKEVVDESLQQLQASWALDQTTRRRG